MRKLTTKGMLAFWRQALSEMSMGAMSQEQGAALQTLTVLALAVRKPSDVSSGWRLRAVVRAELLLMRASPVLWLVKAVGFVALTVVAEGVMFG